MNDTIEMKPSVGIGLGTLLLASLMVSNGCAHSVKYVDPPESCASRLKHLGVGLMFYANDYDGHLPVRQWMAAAKSGRASDGSERCTAFAKGSSFYGYKMIQQVAGGNVADAQVEGAVWLIDATNAGPNQFGSLLDLPVPARHPGGNNLLLGTLQVKQFR